MKAGTFLASLSSWVTTERLPRLAATHLGKTQRQHRAPNQSTLELVTVTLHRPENVLGLAPETLQPLRPLRAPRQPLACRRQCPLSGSGKNELNDRHWRGGVVGYFEPNVRFGPEADILLWV